MSRGKTRTCKGKIRYRDSQEAQRCLRGLEKFSVRDKRAQRSYYCARCKGYHVTSQEDIYA